MSSSPSYYELGYLARSFYRGNGTLRDYPISFPGGAPLDKTHVEVYLEATRQYVGWVVVTINGNDYIRFTDPPPYPSGEDSSPNIMLKRVTPYLASTRMVDFAAGSLLSADDLDKSQLNSMYASQESADLFLDQGGAAVNVTFPQTIGGSKTFTAPLVVSGGLRFTTGTPIGGGEGGTASTNFVGGKQYVLAAADSTGVVHWEETSLTSLPANVVMTDSPTTQQDIAVQKKFSAPLEIATTLKITATNALNKALVSTDNAGTAGWLPVVNGIRLGDATAAISTGVLTITPDSIGALAANTTGGGTQTVGVPVNFINSISLGDNAAADILTITSQLLIPTNAVAGQVLTCGVGGQASWQPPTATGITSINNYTTSTVFLSAADVGAVGITGTQNIDGEKTFTNNVTLGTDSNDNIYIGGALRIPGGTNGMVLMASGDGTQAIWQNATAAGVSKVNGATGEIFITADSLGAYSPTGVYPLPVATGNQKGIMQVGGGLAVDAAGVVSVTQNATLPIATADVLGGIKIGSGLSINSVTGVVSATLNGSVGVNLFKGRAGDVTPEVNDYQASMIKNLDGSNAAVTTDSAQDITASKKFTALQTVSTASGAVGTPGSIGVSLSPTGLIKAQASAINTPVFQAINSGGGVKAMIDSDGDATFDGLVTANGGFYSHAGMTIGQNAGSGISITGTLKYSGAGTPLVGSVLSCTAVDITGAVGTVSWGPPSSAPVSSIAINGQAAMTGIINITADGGGLGGLGAVTRSGLQTIDGTKTFSVAQIFNSDVTLGNALADTITVGGVLKIPASAVTGTVLTCGTGGAASWAPAPVFTVNGQAGEVVLTFTDVGAPSVAQLTTVSNIASAAQTAANTAVTNAAAAQTTANGKLSAVSVDTTTPSSGGAITCLSGNGTTGTPLKVLGALPLGPAGGDLTGAYPSPTIATGAVTLGKMQQIPGRCLLGGNTSNATTVNAAIQTITVGTGLGFVDGALTNTAPSTVSLGTANTWSNTNAFQGTVTIGNETTDVLTVNSQMSTVSTVTLGVFGQVTPAQITVNGPLKITSGSPAAGQVLTCDGSGNATWEPVAILDTTVSNTSVGSLQFLGWTDYNPTNQFTPDAFYDTHVTFPTPNLLVLSGTGGQTKVFAAAGVGTWKARRNSGTGDLALMNVEYTFTATSGPKLSELHFTPHWVLVRIA